MSENKGYDNNFEKTEKCDLKNETFSDEIQNKNKQEIKGEDKVEVENNVKNEEIKNSEEKQNENIEICIDEEIELEEKVNEEEQNLKEYKYQIEQDIITYERNLLSYKQWALDVKELGLKSEKTFCKINSIVEEFNKNISIKLEQLDDEDKKFIENRIKGINMINKMSKNAINNEISKLSQNDILDFNDKKIITDITNKGKDEMRRMLNENYSNITYIESQKSNLINMHLNFISGNLLPIVDGIESGISFVENSTKEIVESQILPIYKQLKICFYDLLLSINVDKIEAQLKKSKINFNLVEILDIEDTEDIVLDETIESVIRSGYEYKKDIYNVGHNHILRQAQVVVYKCKKQLGGKP